MQTCLEGKQTLVLALVRVFSASKATCSSYVPVACSAFKSNSALVSLHPRILSLCQLQAQLRKVAVPTAWP